MLQIGDKVQMENCMQLEDAIEAVPHEEPQLHEDRIPGPVEIVPDRSRYPRRQHRPPDCYGAVPY